MLASFFDSPVVVWQTKIHEEAFLAGLSLFDDVAPLSTYTSHMHLVHMHLSRPSL